MFRSLLTAMAALILLQSQASSTLVQRTTTDDLRLRSTAIRWPPKFNPSKAGSFAHNELTIHAGCSTVWSHLVDISQWPRWLIITPHARWLDTSSSAALGARFQWQILGYQEESEVKEFVPTERFGWTSYTPGQSPLYYHAWLLQSIPSGCRVITEEVGIGPDAVKTARSGNTETHRAHELWLASLRWVSEI